MWLIRLVQISSCFHPLHWKLVFANLQFARLEKGICNSRIVETSQCGVFSTFPDLDTFWLIFLTHWFSAKVCNPQNSSSNSGLMGCCRFVRNRVFVRVLSFILTLTVGMVFVLTSILGKVGRVGTCPYRLQILCGSFLLFGHNHRRRAWPVGLLLHEHATKLQHSCLAAPKSEGCKKS